MATIATLAELAALFTLMEPATPWYSTVAPHATVPPERLTFIVTSPARRTATPAPPDRRVERPPSAFVRAPAVTGARTDPVVVVPEDTSAATDEHAGQSRTGASTNRLLPLAMKSGAAPIGPIRGRNPFAPPAPLSRVAMDSTLGELNHAMPALIRSRIPTQAERDAAAKTATLAMRLAGRPLLVPADPHLIPGGGSIPAPLFSSGPSRARRLRDSIALAENRRRIERLQARARARHDSVRLADSIARQVAPVP